MRRLAALLLLLCAAAVSAQEDAGTEGPVRSVITIVSAQRTEYRKDEQGGGDCIVLSGDVRVSVRRGGTTVTISAQHVTYNRGTEMIYARGAVSLAQSKDGKEGGESTGADSLLFNTSTLEGVFDNGRVVQAASETVNLPSGSTLIVASDLFGTDGGGTIAFKSAELTFCDDENPHWRLKATRIWLLPGGEFAFFNALLYVGHIPLFYFPVFYYPKDELVYNPVFGYSRQRGYFMQNTLYLYGRKGIRASSDGDDGKDYFSFVSAGRLKEQRREGLVLHNLEEDFSGSTDTYAKLMLDYYSNLGYMVGFDTALRPGKYVSEFDFSVNLAFSDTVFYDRYGNYNNISDSGRIYRDTAFFLGKELPFRYKGNLRLAMEKPLTLSLSMPTYSDPYFADDFDERGEHMNWFELALDHDGDDDEDDEAGAEISSYTWDLRGSYSAPLPESVLPHLDTLALTSFDASIVFASVTNSVISSMSSAEDSDGWRNFTPERKFYAPSQVTPVGFAMRIAGDIFSTERASGSARKGPASYSFPLYAPESMSESSVPDGPDKDDAALPEIAFPAPAVTPISDFDYRLSYAISPEYTSQLSYDTSVLARPDDFEWGEIQSSFYSVRVPVQLSSSAAVRDGFISLTDSVLFSPAYQKHPSLAGYTSESTVNSIKKADYAARKFDVSNSNSLSIRPFVYSPYFRETGVTWSTTLRLVRTNFIGDAENPEWEYLTVDFDDEDSFTEHSLDMLLAAREGEFGQRLQLSSNLPPQVSEYTGTLTLTAPRASLNMSAGVRQRSQDDDTWEKKPFQQSFSLSLLSGRLSFTESYNYNLEEKYHDSLKLALNAGGLQLAYTAQYTYGYDFDPDSGWTAKSEREFLPVTFSAAYAPTNRTFRYWKSRIAFAPSVSAGLVYDCLRPTNSYLKFIPSLTFRINDFLNIKFSSESRNNVIYRYVQDYMGLEARIGGETNMLKDLLDSFRFDDDDLRKGSGFKLQNFNIEISHDLCDWNLAAEMSVKPRLLTGTDGGQYYDFSPSMTFSVVWRPMSAMRTEIIDRYGEWDLEF